jgi:carbonic anhydrase
LNKKYTVEQGLVKKLQDIEGVNNRPVQPVAATTVIARF